MASCRATQKICFLTTTHGHLPSLSYKTIFSHDAGFSYSLLVTALVPEIFKGTLSRYLATLQKGRRHLRHQLNSKTNDLVLLFKTI